MLRFTVKGRPHEPLPSVTSLRFKGIEKCMAPIKWDENAPISPLPPPPINGLPDPDIPDDHIVQPVVTTTTPRPKPISECGVRQVSKQGKIFIDN